MAGLKYGNSYRMQNRYETNKEGVFFASRIKKYIVRIKIKGTISTISQHKKEENANSAYKKIKDNE